MCGICGIYYLNDSPIDRDLLDKMTAIMKHRGPDGTGVYIADGIGLGHRRLSIIDILGGSQPMKNEDGNLNIVFNGEIYNFVELREELKKKGHKFVTRSDTEVIIHSYEQWGVDCLNRFNGIFAFAIWDCKLKQLFLARDHLGVKPLYYISDDRKFAFASEIKSLLEDKSLPRSVNLEALAQLFTFRYVPSPLTLFNGIYKLPPGHYLLINSNKLEIKQYWTKLPSIMNHQNEKQLIEEYRYLLEDAVRLQLRSDVPVGLFLSSGIDSGAILAIMKNYVTTPIHTFTIGFEDGSNTNETEDARQLAQKFGTNHSEMIVTPQDYQKYFDS